MAANFRGVMERWRRDEVKCELTSCFNEKEVNLMTYFTHLTVHTGLKGTCLVMSYYLKY